MLTQNTKIGEAIVALEKEIKEKQLALAALKSLVNVEEKKQASPVRQRTRRSKSAGLIARQILVKDGGEMAGDELFLKILENGGNIKERNLQTSLSREPGIVNVGFNVWKAVDIEESDKMT